MAALNRTIGEWAIRIRTRGFSPDNKPLAAEAGTGFFFDTKGTNTSMAITALHVLREDVAYSTDYANTPRRVIEFDTRGEFGPEPHTNAAQPRVQQMGGQDAAIMFLNGYGRNGLRFSKRQLNPGETLIALPWSNSEPRPDARPVVLQPDRDPAHPDLLKISGDFVVSESGSPILGQDGLVVALLTHHGLSSDKKKFGLAIPSAAFFQRDLPSALYGRKQEDQDTCVTSITRFLRSTRTLRTEQVLACPEDSGLASPLGIDVPVGFVLDGVPQVTIEPAEAGTSTTVSVGSSSPVQQTISCSPASLTRQKV